MSNEYLDSILVHAVVLIENSTHFVFLCFPISSEEDYDDVVHEDDTETSSTKKNFYIFKV